MAGTSATDRVIELVNDSLERCRQTPRFLDVFYERLLGTSPEIAAMFAKTDLHQQKHRLNLSFYFLLSTARDKTEAAREMQRLAAVHATLGVPRRFYGVWLNCLVEAVAVSDPQFTPEIGEAWRAFLAPGIALMQAAASK